MSESARAADSMQVSLSQFREIEINDDIDVRDINTSGHQIGGDEASAGVVAEVMVNAVTVLLVHLSVNVVAREAHVSDFLS